MAAHGGAQAAMSLQKVITISETERLILECCGLCCYSQAMFGSN